MNDPAVFETYVFVVDSIFIEGFMRRLVDVGIDSGLMGSPGRRICVSDMLELFSDQFIRRS